VCGTMSAFIDIAAEESGDDDNLDHQPDEEPANVAGYDTSDGFVVVDEEHDLEVANRRTASRRADKAFEKHLDQAELEEETRQLALDHGLAIPKERKRLKKRKQASCSSTVDALDTYLNSCIVEEEKEEAAAQEELRMERKRQRREAKLKQRKSPSSHHTQHALLDKSMGSRASKHPRNAADKGRRNGKSSHIPDEQVGACTATVAVGNIPRKPGRAWTVDLFG